MRINTPRIPLVALAFASCVSGYACGAEWGDLKIRFLLDGDVPIPAKLAITKDMEVCGPPGLVDEQLVVNPANKGIANVLVFLRSDKTPPIHESYTATAKGSVTLDNEKCRFEPRVVGLRTTQSLLVGNKDSVGHNTNVTPVTNPGQNVLIPASGSATMSFQMPENLPSKVACNIHPWMTGYIMIKDHPYIGVSDKDGNLLIKNLPAGKWTFQIWQEASGYVQEATQDGKKVMWSRGRPEIEITKGVTDLKDVKLAKSIFKLQ